MSVEMTDHLHKIASIIVGDHDLAIVWVGLVSSAISSILMLRIYFGRSFAYYVKLIDVFYWALGVYVFMRSSMLIVTFSKVTHFIKIEGLDSTVMGFLAGIVNVYLFKNNYKPILDFVSKWLKPHPEIEKILSTKDKIQEIIKSIENHFEHKVYVFFSELTNGGSVPRPDKPLYFTVLESTDRDVLNLWGLGKHLSSSCMIKNLILMFTNGYASLKTTDINLEYFDKWCESRGVSEMNYYLIGADGSKRALMFIVVSEKKISDNDNIRMISYARELKKVINVNRKIFEKKIS